MKWFAKCMIAAFISCAAVTGHSQALAMANIGTNGMVTETKAAAPVDAKELTVTIKNDCEKHITIFAGSKKEVFDGKGQSLGGISTNTLYIKEGDVICIMNDPKTIQACAIAKDGLSKVEINKSGNGFVK